MTDTTAAFRFGFGLPLPEGAPTTPEAMMAALRGPDLAAQTHFGGGGMVELLPLMENMRLARIEYKKNPDKKGAGKAERRAVQATHAMATVFMRATIARAVDSPDGLRERLAAFWADHFTTVSRSKLDRALPGSLMEDAIRPNLTGRFAALLQAVTLHPAMLIYLDQVNSIGPTSTRGKRRGKGLNENLARELMELHTLGVGSAYTQADVREMAELLTGLTFVGDKGFAFDQSRVEPGPDQVLGVSYDGKGLDPIKAALTDLARHPDTVRHVSGKLATHFVADTPDAGLVEALVAAWQDSDGDLGMVTQALLTHPAVWQAPPAKARQPFEFLVAGLRALGISGADVVAMPDKEFTNYIAGRLRDMGQPWHGAGGPDGWPEAAEAWINPQRLASRITWAMEVPARLVDPLPDPRDFAARALGDRASEVLMVAAGRAESLREGVGLVLASPEFNRR
ncbi:MAG: DUF1800 domain-containing protein [Pseudomonadota bacterium]